MKTFRFIVVIFFLAAATTASGQDTLIQSANRAAAEYRERLQHLVDWAKDKGLHAEAAETLRILPPEAGDKVFFPTFPRDIGTLNLPKGLPTILPREYAAAFQEKNRNATDGGDENTQPDNIESEKSDAGAAKNKRPQRELTDREVWQIQLRIIRQDYAKRLNTLARTASKRDRGTLAVQMAIAGLQADPDMPVFRNVFSYIKYKNEWRTPWELDRIRKGFVDHEKFGWIPQKAVKRYENGERYCNDKWVTVAEAEAYHGRSIENGWQIQSEHYDLLTNHSLEEGVRLVRQIEDLYMVWKFMFFRYMATDPQLASLFDGKATPVPTRRHMIYLYKDKDDFTRDLTPKMNRDVSQFAGFYRHGTHIKGACFFYSVPAGASDWDRTNVTRTMFHEATHQLFIEARAEEKHGYAKNANYWLIEGAATFMESLRREDDGYYAVGGDQDQRLRSARRMADKFTVDYMCTLTNETFTTHPRMGDLYTQSCAMFHFLYFHEGGQWRDPLIVYLRTVYDGKDDQSTLRKITETPYGELDRKFEAYLKE